MAAGDRRLPAWARVEVLGQTALWAWLAFQVGLVVAEERVTYPGELEGGRRLPRQRIVNESRGAAPGAPPDGEAVDAAEDTA